MAKRGESALLKKAKKQWEGQKRVLGYDERPTSDPTATLKDSPVGADGRAKYSQFKPSPTLKKAMKLWKDPEYAGYAERTATESGHSVSNADFARTQRERQKEKERQKLLKQGLRGDRSKISELSEWAKKIRTAKDYDSIRGDVGKADGYKDYFRENAKSYDAGTLRQVAQLLKLTDGEIRHKQEADLQKRMNLPETEKTGTSGYGTDIDWQRDLMDRWRASQGEKELKDKVDKDIYNKKDAEYAALMQNPDFAERSRYKGDASPKKSVGFYNIDKPITPETYALYEYVNKNPGVVRNADEEGFISDVGRLGYTNRFMEQNEGKQVDMLRPETKDKTWAERIISGASGASGLVDAYNELKSMAYVGKNFAGIGDYRALSEMKDDEIGIFNYIDSTQGREKALEYVKHLMPQLTERQRETNTERAETFADDMPVLASAATVADSPVKGLSYVGQAIDYATDGKIDQNASYNQLSYTPTAVRNRVSEKVAENYGEAGSFLYNTGMSMADFLVNMGISGGSQAAVLAIMGSGAAADTVIRAKDRGLDDGQAFALGTIAGAAEAMCERVSIEVLLDSIGKSTFKSIAKNFLAEGSEEVATDLINTMADIAVAKDQSEWKQTIKAYMDQGYSEQEAFGRAFADQAKQMGLSFAAGGISGGVFGAGASIPGVGNAVGGYFRRSNESTVDYDTNFAEGRTGSDESLAQEETSRQLKERMEKAARDMVAEEAGEEAALQAQEIAAEQAELDEVRQNEVEPITASPIEERANTGEIESPEEVLARTAQEQIDEEEAQKQRRREEFKAELDENSSMGEKGKQDFGLFSELLFRDTADMRPKQAQKYIAKMSAAFTEGYQEGVNGRESNRPIRSTRDEAFMIGMNAGIEDGRRQLVSRLAETRDEERIEPERDNGLAVFENEKAGITETPELLAMMEATDENGNPVLSQEHFGRMNSLAKALGVRANMVEEIPGNKSAKYDPKTGEITISLKASPEMMVQEYFKHESVHRIKDVSKEAYDSMENAVIKQLEEEGTYEQIFNKYKAVLEDAGTLEGVEDVNATVHEEIVADYIAQMEESDQIIDDFLRNSLGTKEGRTLIQVLRDFFREMGAKLKGTARGKRYSEIGQKFADGLEGVHRTVGTAQKNGGAVSETATKNTETKFSPKKSYSYEELISQPPMHIYTPQDFSLKQISFSDGITKDDVVETTRKNVKKYNDEKGNNLGPYKLYNRNIGVVDIGKPGIRHSFHRFNNSMTTERNIKAAINIPLYFENALVVNEGDGQGTKSNPDKAYVLMGAYKEGDVLSFSRMLVNSNTNELEEVKNLYSISTKKKDDANEIARVFKALSSSSEISIADFLELVKNYYPDELSQDVADHLGYERKPSKDISGLKFAMQSEVEETPALIALHNMQQEDLANMINLGGLPMPSIAIVKAQAGHTKYGDVSIVFGKETIDPQRSRDNKVYGGDAYTPTFPTIEKKINSKVAENIRKKLTGIFGMGPYEQTLADDLRLPSLDEENILNKIRYREPYEAYKNEDSLKLAYLKNAKSFDVAIPMKEGKLHGFEENVWELLDSKLPNVSRAEAVNMDYNVAMEFDETIRDILRFVKNIKSGKHMPYSKPLGWGEITNIFKDLVTYRQQGVPEVVDYDELHKVLDAKVDEKGYEKWINELFEGIVEKEGVRNNKDYFTPAGNRRKWEVLHDPVTLDNVVRIMKNELDAGSNGLFGANPKGAAQKTYNSIDEIKADSGRLQMLDDEEFKQLESDAVQKMSDVCVDIVSHNPRRFTSSFVGALDVGEFVAETINKTRTREGIKRTLKKDYWLDVTEEQMDSLMDAINSIANLPTGYFEAKPKRAVHFDEIRGIVVPDNIDDELRTQLINRGVNVIEYETGNDADRLEKVNSIEDVRFSTPGTANIIKHVRTQAETAELEKRIKELEGEFKRNKGYKASVPAAQKAVKNLINRYSVNTAEAGIDKAKLTEQFVDMANKLARTPEQSYSDVRAEVTKLANTIIHNSEELVETGNMADDARKFLRNQKIYIDPTTRNDRADFDDIRKGYFGKLTMTYDKGKGRAIDDLYSELNAEYPWLFPEDITNMSDQFEQILNVMEMAEYISINPYSEYDADTVDMLTNDIMGDLLTLMGVKDPDTFADKAYKSKWKLVNERESRLKQNYNERIERIKKQRDEKYARLEQYYKDRAERAKERKTNSKAREDLLKTMKKLERLKTTGANRAVIEEALGVFDSTAASITGKTLKNLSDLRMWVNEQKLNDTDYIVDPVTRNKLERLEKIQKQIEESGRTLEDVLKEGKGWQQFSSVEIMIELTETLKGIETQIRNERKTIDTEDRRDTFMQGLVSIDAVNNSYGINSRAAKFIDRWIFTEAARPETELLRVCGYNEDAPLFQRFKDITKGQLKMVDYSKRANEKYFDKFINDKEFIKGVSGKHAREIEISGLNEDGKEVKLNVTPDLLMSMYMHSLNDQNVRHIDIGGMTVPDVTLYKQGKIKDAYDKGIKITMGRKALRDFASQNLNQKEKAFIQNAQLYYKYMSQPEINAVSEKLLGYSVARVDNYYRIVTDKNWMKSDLGAIKFDGTLEGMGFLLERTNAPNPIELVGMITQVTSDIRQHSRYVGLAIPIRNFNKVYNVSAKSFNDNGEVDVHYAASVKETISNKWGSTANDYIAKMLSDIQNPRRSADTYGSLLSKVRSKYAGAVLTLNAGVSIKQAASYPTAAAEIGWDPLVKALVTVHKVKGKDSKFIAQYSPLMRLRQEGYVSQETGDIIETKGKRLPRGLNWIQTVDLATVRTLWLASEYSVMKTNPELKYGTKAFYEKVGEVHTRVIEKTQPNYTELQRAQVLRSENELVRMLNMFKTQPLQNFNILLEGFGNYRAKNIAYKNNPNEKTLAAKKQAGVKLRRAVSSQVVAAFVFAAMQWLWDLFRGKSDKYKDKEGENTLPGFLRGVGLNMVSSLGGMIPTFGSALVEGAEYATDTVATALGSENPIFDQEFYGINAGSSLEGLNNVFVGAIGAVEAFIGLGREIHNSAESGSSVDWEQFGRDVVKSGSEIGQFFGVPVDNIKNLATGGVGMGYRIGEGDYIGQYMTMRVGYGVTSQNKRQYFNNLIQAYKHKDDLNRAYGDQFDKLYEIMINDDAFATSSKTAKENVDAALKEVYQNEARQGIGITDEVYEDYNKALNKYDDNHNGSYTQEEVFNALNSMKLNNKQRQELWAENGWKKSYTQYLADRNKKKTK